MDRRTERRDEGVVIGGAVTRRRFMQYGAGAGAGLVVWRFAGGRAWAAAPPSGVLDPLSIPKYVTPLVIPPAMPRSAQASRKARAGQSTTTRSRCASSGSTILPPSMGLEPTTGLELRLGGPPGDVQLPGVHDRGRRGAGRCASSGSTASSSRTATSGRICCRSTRRSTGPIRPAAPQGRDGHGSDQSPYRGPVPIVTHLHGGHSSEESDGYPEAWYLPAARNIPGGLRQTRLALPEVPGTGPAARSARPGRPAARSSSTTTTSARRRCGTTTTRSG